MSIVRLCFVLKKEHSRTGSDSRASKKQIWKERGDPELERADQSAAKDQFARDQVIGLRAQVLSWHLFARWFGVSVASVRRVAAGGT